jgi:hypothetical protein
MAVFEKRQKEKGGGMGVGRGGGGDKKDGIWLWGGGKGFDRIHSLRRFFGKAKYKFYLQP